MKVKRRPDPVNNLFFFNLNNNQLTGTIPDEFGKLTSLASLLLADNRLCGEIPASLLNLTNMRDDGEKVWGGIDIKNNFLTTENTALAAFLVQNGSDWESSQGEICPSSFSWNLFFPAIIGDRQRLKKSCSLHATRLLVQQARSDQKT